VLAYFDTSALVPLVIEEHGSRLCDEQWHRADVIVTSSLAYVEVHGALAQAVRQDRMDDDARDVALSVFQSRWKDVIHVPPGDALVKTAATLAASHALRGCDAVHCATALTVASDDFVALSGDRDLLRAWGELGIAVIDTSA